MSIRSANSKIDREEKILLDYWERKLGHKGKNNSGILMNRKSQGLENM